MEADGDEMISSLEAEAHRHGFTLDIAGAASMTAISLDQWVASGMKGARDCWRDPADHVIAGYVASRPGEPPIIVRPSPRRSVGPDLFALLAGCENRYFSLQKASIRMHRIGVARHETPPFLFDRQSAVSAGEEALLDAVADALAFQR